RPAASKARRTVSGRLAARRFARPAIPPIRLRSLDATPAPTPGPAGGRDPRLSKRRHADPRWLLKVGPPLDERQQRNDPTDFLRRKWFSVWRRPGRSALILIGPVMT